MSADNEINCGNCRFWQTGFNEGMCKKNKLSPGFPSAKASSWCGEFKRKLVHNEENRNFGPDELPERICGNCVSFVCKKDSAESLGACRYNPPVITIYENGNSVTRFPVIKKIHYCDKFRLDIKKLELGEEKVLTMGERAIEL